MKPELEHSSKHLLISVSGQTFAIPSLQVVEICPAIRPTKLPFVPHYIAGLVNIKGSVIPLLSLSAYMGVQHLSLDSRNKESIFIIVMSGNAHFAITADAAIDEVDTVDDSVIVLDVQQFHNIIQPTESGSDNAGGLLGKFDKHEQHETEIALLGFQTLGERFGFHLDEIAEVVEVEAVIPVPGAPDCVTGLVTLRGDALLVLSFEVLLGRPRPTTTDKKLLVVLEREQSYYGIDISVPVAISTFAQSRLQKSPNEQSQFASVFIDAQEQATVLLTGKELIADALHKKLKDLAPKVGNKNTAVIKNVAVLHFAINELSYAMPLDYVHMVSKAHKIIEVNDSAKRVFGVVEIEGRIITVLDTRQQLGVLDIHAPGLQYVIIGDTKTEWAIPVSRINAILDIPETDIETIVSGDLKHLSGIAHHHLHTGQTQLIPVLNVRELFPSE